MINLVSLGSISPIFLTVFLIIYLILAELGTKKMRENLLPLIIALMVVFFLILVLSIVSQF